MNQATTRPFRTLLSSNLRAGFALGACVLALTLGAACGDDDDDPYNNGGDGNGGRGGASGAGGRSGASGAGGSPTQGSGGSPTQGAGGAGGSSGASGSGGSATNPITGAGTPQKLNTTVELKFTEGPLWVNSASKLLFTDVAKSKVYEWGEGDADPVEYLGESSKSNGLALLPDGRIARCAHGDHSVRVHTFDAPEATTLVADTFDDGKRLNSPNDVIAHSNGTLYFTDPDFGLNGATPELPYQGVYRAVPNGDTYNVTLESSDLPRPNGIAFSPDESKLYVAYTAGSIVRSFQVAADGKLSAPTQFASTDTDGAGPEGGGDGVTVDDAGNVYVATNVGVRVYAPDGSTWGTLAFPEVPSNVAFGGADRKSLFVTAQTSVFRVTLASATGKP